MWSNLFRKQSHLPSKLVSASDKEAIRCSIYDHEVERINDSTISLAFLLDTEVIPKKFISKKGVPDVIKVVLEIVQSLADVDLNDKIEAHASVHADCTEIEFLLPARHHHAMSRMRSKFIEESNKDYSSYSYGKERYIDPLIEHLIPKITKDFGVDAVRTEENKKELDLALRSVRFDVYELFTKRWEKEHGSPYIRDKDLEGWRNHIVNSIQELRKLTNKEAAPAQDKLYLKSIEKAYTQACPTNVKS